MAAGGWCASAYLVVVLFFGHVRNGNREERAVGDVSHVHLVRRRVLCCVGWEARAVLRHCCGAACVWSVGIPEDGFGKGGNTALLWTLLLLIPVGPHFRAWWGGNGCWPRHRLRLQEQVYWFSYGSRLCLVDFSLRLRSVCSWLAIRLPVVAIFFVS